jgi:hypothetical protein
MISPRMPRRLALLVPLLAVAGCAPAGSTGVNTTSFKGDAKAVATTLNDLSSAARSKDGKKACSQLLSRAVVGALGANCTKVMNDQFDDADTFKLDVLSIAVRGDRATARVRSDFNGTKRVTALPLVREGGSWRVDRVAG